MMRSTEKLVLGLIGGEDTSIMAFLKEFGTTPERVREEVMRLLGKGEGDCPEDIDAKALKAERFITMKEKTEEKEMRRHVADLLVALGELMKKMG